jgi:hypothetical protein
MLSTTIKLDKVREVRFTIGAQIRIENELSRKIHVLMTDMSLEEAVKMLAVALALEDPELTYEKTLELVERYADSTNAVVECVTKALILAVSGKKGQDFLNSIEGDQGKNASGPATTGTSS